MDPLTMSPMGVRVADITFAIDHRMDSRTRAVRGEVSPRMFHVERAIARYDLPLEDTIRHRTKHR